MKPTKYIELHTENIETIIVPIEKIVTLSFRPIESKLELVNGRFVKDSYYENYITDVVLIINDSDKVMKIKYPESSGGETEIDITKRSDYTHLVFNNNGKETKYTLQWFGNAEYENEGALWENEKFMDDESDPEIEVCRWIFSSNINNYGKLLSSKNK